MNPQHNVIVPLLLEKIFFEYQTNTSRDVLRNMTIETFIDFETRSLRTLFRTFIPGRIVREEVKEQMKIYYSWWGHFRDTCLPHWLWLRKLLPSRYYLQPIRINHYHLCPHTGYLSESKRKDFHLAFLQGDESIEAEEKEI